MPAESRPYQARDLVRGWVQRSYLKRDGWWAQLILDEFDFLIDIGFSLSSSAIAGIHFHQKGNYIWFERSGTQPASISFDYDPESGGWIGAEIEINGSRSELDAFVRGFDTLAVPPKWMLRPPQDLSKATWDELVRDPEPITDREHIELKTRWWAARLKDAVQNGLI